MLNVFYRSVNLCRGVLLRVEILNCFRCFDALCVVITNSDENFKLKVETNQSKEGLLLYLL